MAWSKAGLEQLMLVFFLSGHKRVEQEGGAIRNESICSEYSSRLCFFKTGNYRREMGNAEGFAAGVSLPFDLS